MRIQQDLANQHQLLKKIEFLETQLSQAKESMEKLIHTPGKSTETPKQAIIKESIS